MPAQGLVDVGPISLPALPPTFLGLAAAAPLPGMDGEDLLGATGQRRGRAMSGLGAWRAINDGRSKLIFGKHDAWIQ